MLALGRGNVMPGARLPALPAAGAFGDSAGAVGDSVVFFEDSISTFSFVPAGSGEDCGVSFEDSSAGSFFFILLVELALATLSAGDVKLGRHITVLGVLLLTERDGLVVV